MLVWLIISRLTALQKPMMFSKRSTNLEKFIGSKYLHPPNFLSLLKRLSLNRLFTNGRLKLERFEYMTYLAVDTIRIAHSESRAESISKDEN
jgi:hypothetical protein